MGKLLTHSTSSRSLHDLTRIRLSFISRLLQKSWLEWWWWRAWFRANKLLPDHARRLPPPGGGGRAEGRGRRRDDVPLRRDPDVPAVAAAARTAGMAAAHRPDALRTLRAEGGTGPSSREPDPDPPPRQPNPGLGTPHRSKRVTPRGTRASQLVRPGFLLSPGTASQPQRPQPGRIRSLLYAFTPSSVARVRSTRISIAYSSASQTHPENPPRTKVERASPRDLDVQTRATL